MDTIKKCSSCGREIDDQSKFCPYCGASSLTSAPQEPAEVPEQPTPAAEPTATEAPVIAESENVLAGIVGAFLFSLIGGLLYFVLYQIGVIAGICGLVMFILAQFGYRLLSGNKKSISIPSLITSIVVMLVMIFLAEYICLSFEIFQAYREEFDITFFDAIRATPNFLTESEVLGAVVQDLLFAYGFGIVATISSIVAVVKARKKNA